MKHFLSASCRGVKCDRCGKQSGHKVCEEMFDDDPRFIRHPYSAYLCCEHFCYIMGMTTPCSIDEKIEPKSDIAYIALMRAIDIDA